MASLPENDAAISAIEELIRWGMLNEAEAGCRAMLGRTPGEAWAWTHLGSIQFVRGLLPEAEQALRQAVTLNPSLSDCWNNLSAVLFQQGKLDEAANWARESLRQGNTTAAPWANLGHIGLTRKEWSSAAEAYRRAVAIEASNLAAWTHLTICEQELGRWKAAEAAYVRSIELAPQDLGIRANFGWFLSNRGNAAGALAVLGPALVDRVEAAPAWTVAGHVRNILGDRRGAAEAYRIALKHAPKNSFARHGLAVALRMDWKLAEAEKVIRELLVDEPNFSPGWVLLAGMQAADEAGRSFRRAMEQTPMPGTHSGWLLSMQYAADAEPEALLAAHREWEAAYARPLLPKNPPGVVEKKIGEKLRMGFVSAGFCRHPVGYLGLPAIERLNRERCEVICYNDQLVEDEFTARFKAAASEWKVTAGRSNEEVAEMIREDKIDVLFDLGGHTEDRLLLFARKPAALQITWLGYVGTTGLEAMDCLLADRFHVKPGEEGAYVEQVLRLPNGYVCYGPLADAPEVTPSPALRNGYVTFGSFNNPKKFSSLTLDVWAEVLHSVPSSRLMLKYGGLDQPDYQERFHKEFAARGIERDRVLFSGWSATRELMAAYGEIDLALDTLPYSGGLTTCEALWMGVPVITYPGKTFAGRHSTSHLTNAGLEEFVAADRDGYVRLATDWSGRIGALSELRMKLREQTRRSALCDAEGFAREFVELVCGEWEVRAGR